MAATSPLELEQASANPYEGYQSPFSERYGSPEMRVIWSETNKRLLWRRVWVALARAEHQAGLVTDEELVDLETHMSDIDVTASLSIEAQIGHDLVSEQKVFAKQAPIGGRILHLGATSEDLKGNTDILRMRESVNLLRQKSLGLLQIFADQIDKHASTPCLGRTHLQPAEVTTVGYRLANYAQDILGGVQLLDWTTEHFLKGKGMKGIVGTSASFAQLLQGTDMNSEMLEKIVMDDLGFEAFGVTTQVYPRSTDFVLAGALNTLIIGAARFANDLTLLQSPDIGEMSEPIKGRGRSSAVPFKRNPEIAEKIVALAKYTATSLSSFSETARELAVERRMTDSASRRIEIPELFLAVDEILDRTAEVVGGLVVNQEIIARNLAKYGPFLGTEPLIMELVKRGGDRLQVYEWLRGHSLAAWQKLESGEENTEQHPLLTLILADERITSLIPVDEIGKIMDVTQYVGDAPERAKNFAAQISSYIEQKNQ